jgi:ssDNA-binding Zn-finger/Zn-ribbon topoisomerase 1
MLTLAFNEQEDIIHINDAEKGEIYKCPDCGADVIRVHGDSKAHHYRHKNAEDCGSGGESVVHKYYKQYIASLTEVQLDYMEVPMQVTSSFIEKKLADGLVADVLLVLDGWKSIAVEICYKHAKDREHIEKYRELNIECYEIYVDMNEEQTDFEIVDWDCLWGYDCYDLETYKLELKIKRLEQQIELKNEEICSLQKQIEKNEKNHKQTIDNFTIMIGELEQEKRSKKWEQKQKATNDVEETIKKVTGFTYRQLQSVYYNTKSGNKYYLLDMMQILDCSINDKVKMIQFNWVKERAAMSDNKIFTITFLDWKKNHVVESIYNIKCSTYDFNLLARLVTEIYGVKVYKNENGKY